MTVNIAYPELVWPAAFIHVMYTGHAVIIDSAIESNVAIMQDIKSCGLMTYCTHPKLTQTTSMGIRLFRAGILLKTSL